MKLKRLLYLLLSVSMLLSCASFTGSAASGFLTVFQQESYGTLAEVKADYVSQNESAANGEMLLQDGKPSLKRLGTMNAGDPVSMTREIDPLDSGKYTVYIDTKQAYQGLYKIFLQDATGANRFTIARSYYGDITVQTNGTGGSDVWGVECRNTGALTDSKALLSLKLVVDAEQNTVSAYGKAVPSVANKGESKGGLITNYNTAPKDSEGYVLMKENIELSAGDAIEKISFRLEKSTKATPAGAQMTVESIRVQKEVADLFQYDKDHLTEDFILNGQESAAVTKALNLPQTLAGGTKVEWEAEPADTIDTGSGEVTCPEHGSVDVTLTAHLTESGTESPRKEDISFSLTVVANQETLLKQTTYENDAAFQNDYGTAGSDADAGVSLVNGKPTIVRKTANSGDAVEISRDLPAMTNGVFAIYIDVRQAYQGMCGVFLNERTEQRVSLSRTNYGNLQSPSYSGFTYPYQFRGTGTFDAAAALAQYKFIYAADTGRVMIYVKGTPYSNAAGYNALPKDEEGYALFHEGAADLGEGHTINSIMFRSSKGGSDKANQSGLQVERVQINKIDLDIFSLDVDSLTEEHILNGQEKTEVRDALNLPQVLNYGTPVTWETSPENIIDPLTGEVTRPQSVDTEVTLRAIIDEVGVDQPRQETKEFKVNVISEETDHPKPDLGWMTLLEQPSYATEAEMKADYDMPSGDDVTTGLTQGAPYVIRTKANDGANASMTRALPEMNSGSYVVYVDTLQAYRGEFTMNLKSGNTTRVAFSRNRFGNIQSANYSGFTYGVQFRSMKGFDAADASLKFKFVLDLDANKMSIYMKGTPYNNQADYEAAAKDKEGYVLFGENLAMSAAGPIDKLEIISVKGTGSDTAGQSGVAVKNVVVKEKITSCFDADLYFLTLDHILNGQDALEVRAALKLDKELTYGTLVSWSAQPAGAVDLDTGEVKRQEEVNTPVTLTATLTETGVDAPRTETKEFQFMILNLKADREAQSILDFDQKVLEAGEILADYERVKLPLHGAKGSEISWSSDNALVKIGADGTASITNPTAETEINLTATLKKGMVQATKAFTFKLKPSAKTNLALNHYESCTGNTITGYEPQYAVDGFRDSDKGHRWALSGTLNAEYVINFGAEKSFNKAVIYDSYSRLTRVSVQIRQGNEWVDVASKEQEAVLSGQAVLTLDFAQQTAQQVRLQFEAAKEISIDEIELYLEGGSENSWDTTKAAKNLQVSDISSDDLMALTMLKTLPRTDAATGAQIEWVSANETVLDPQTGAVNRPAGADELVQLFAVITKPGECLRVRTFVINVLGQNQGLHYFVNEAFDDDSYMTDQNWTFSEPAQIAGGKLSMNGAAVRIQLVGPAFTDTRGGNFKLELTPAGSGTVRFLNAAGEVIIEAVVTKDASGTKIELGGMTAYALTEEGAERFYLEFDTDLNRHLFQVKVNGNVMASSQPLEQSADLKAAELNIAGTLDHVQSYTQTGSGEDSVLHMIAQQASPLLVTGQPAEAVTKNIVLSSQPLRGIGCRWSSSAADIIALDGTVTRRNGSGADPVTLTGEFYLSAAPENVQQAQIVLQVAQIGASGVNAGKAVYSNAQPEEGSSLENVSDASALTAFVTNGFGDATEIMFHLGGEVAFNHIIMQEQKINDAYNIGSAVVEISNDRSQWTAVAQTEEVGQLQDITLDKTVKAVYVRFSFTKKTDGPIAVAELTVARGGALGGPDTQTDLEGIMGKMPGNFNLTASFTVPLTGESGSAVTVQSSNSQAAQVTRGAESWQVLVTRQKDTDQEVVFTVTCAADGVPSAVKTRTYSIPKTGTSSGNTGGGNSGGGSGGSGGGGAAVVPQQTPQPTPQPTGQPDPARPPESQPFSDMEDAQWAIPYVAKLKELGAVSGDQEGKFHPNASANREEFVKILVCALGEEISQDTDAELPFTDVERDAWYYPYLVKAYQMNLIQGVSETEFGIGQTISRQDMATVIYRQSAQKRPSINETTFTDSGQIANYAKEAVQYLQEAGVLSGDEQGRFNPWNATTKAEVAKVVCSILE